MPAYSSDKGFTGNARGSAKGGSSAASAGRAAAGKTASAPQPKERLYKNEYGLETSYGAPVKTNKLGVQTALPEKPTAGKPAMSWGNWKDQVGTYNKAATEWNGEKIQNNVLGWALPFGLQNVAPRLDQPATYTGGTYHFGMNPAAAAGAVGGMALGGAGAALGPVMGGIYGLAGGKNLVFSGPDVPSGWDPKGNAPADTSGPMGQSASPQGGSTGTGGMQPQIPGPMKAPTPAIFSQPLAQTGGNPVPPGIFPPKPPVQTAFQVPGGKPYGFSLFGRAA